MTIVGAFVSCNGVLGGTLVDHDTIRITLPTSCQVPLRSSNA